jgi:hypothetical protein
MSKETDFVSSLISSSSNANYSMESCKECLDYKVDLNKINDIKLHSCNECGRMFILHTIDSNELTSIQSVLTEPTILVEEYLYKPWQIRSTDVIPLSVMYSSAINEYGHTIIPSVSIFEQTNGFNFKSKCFRIGGYNSKRNTTFKFVHNNEISLKTRGFFFIYYFKYFINVARPNYAKNF